MRRLYIDFDGVVMDTIPALYKLLEKHGVSSKDEEQVRKIFSAYDFRQIIKDKYILNDSINCINRLIESRRFEISFLSHVNSLDEGTVKIKYLRKYFKGDINIIIVPKGISKTTIVHSEGAILVDDYSGNLREWQETGGISVRFSNELESKGYKVINRLDGLLDLFDENGDEIC